MVTNGGGIYVLVETAFSSSAGTVTNGSTNRLITVARNTRVSAGMR